MTDTVLLTLDVLSADDDRADLAATIHRYEVGAPVLPVSDLAVLRGDGVFETFGVIGGAAQEVDAHLARLARSAAMLDLPAPHEGQWRRAIALAAATVDPAGEGQVRIVLSRGLDGSGRATGWVTAANAASGHPQRRDGIDVITLDRGYPSDVAARAPWLLAGAKTLSYAINMAGIREARRRGADDTVFVTTDGFVLEAPTSTVILRAGGVFVSPEVEIGILPGTSQLALFEELRRRGDRVEQRPVTVEELRAADTVWLVSSIRLLAPVRSLDGEARAFDAALTAELNDVLLARRS